MPKRFTVTLVLLLLSSSYIFAENNALTRDKRYFFFVTGNYSYTRSVADEVSGADYQERMRNPFILKLSSGMTFLESIYVGVSYETWYARRVFSNAGVRQSDMLHYQAVGADFGYMSQNPRVRYLATASASVPIELRVTSSRAGTTGDFTTTKRPIMFQLRGLIAIAFNPIFSLILETGYRVSPFGDLTAGGASLLTGGAGLTLSGPFIGIGAGAHF